MIEATIHNVIVRVPKGEEVRWPGDTEDWSKLMGAWVMLLKEMSQQRCPQGFLCLAPWLLISWPSWSTWRGTRSRTLE